MDGARFKEIRLALGLTRTEWGEALGYTGDGIARQMGRFETGERGKIPVWIARLAVMYEHYGVPPWASWPFVMASVKAISGSTARRKGLRR